MLSEIQLEKINEPLLSWFETHKKSSSMERKSDTLSRMGVGNYVTADPSRGRQAIF